MVSAGMSEKSSTPLEAIQAGPSVNVNPPRTFSTALRPVRGSIPVMGVECADGSVAGPEEPPQAAQKEVVARTKAARTTHFGIRMAARAYPQAGSCHQRGHGQDVTVGPADLRCESIGAKIIRW